MKLSTIDFEDFIKDIKEIQTSKKSAFPSKYLDDLKKKKKTESIYGPISGVGVHPSTVQTVPKQIDVDVSRDSGYCVNAHNGDITFVVGFYKTPERKVAGEIFPTLMEANFRSLEILIAKIEKANSEFNQLTTVKNITRNILGDTEHMSIDVMRSKYDKIKKEHPEFVF